MKLPDFNTKEDLFKWLHENRARVEQAKKAEMKRADAVCVYASDVELKAEPEGGNDTGVLQKTLVINTTNLMDSHDDVHIPGLWKKSLSENKNIWHDQEHLHTFDSTISEGKDLKAYTKTMTWKELGQKWEGETQALVFDSTIRKDRNEKMYGHYKDGHVNNHSVGMQYVKIALAINAPNYKEEYDTWKKYIDQIVNKEDAEAQGYFFAVTEAKVVEGSAVKRGSNWVTPTLNSAFDEEPPKGTPKDTEPGKSTPLTSEQIIEKINNF